MVAILEDVEYDESDIRWVQNLMLVLSDNGAWICPCTQSMFTFNKPKKTYSLTGDECDYTNRVTMAILEKECGYKKEGTK